MSYWQFHLFLIGPAVLLGAAAWTLLKWRADGSPRSSAEWEVGALGLIAGIAFIYTLPWDHLLISWEVWTYDPGRVTATIWGVPVEECAFFLLQPLLAGSWYAVAVRLYRRHWEREGPSTSARQSLETESTVLDARSSWMGAALGAMLAALGAGLLATESSFYLGMILLWAGPVLALQWGLRGRLFWQCRRLMFLSVGPATLYLWMADGLALHLGIWHISPQYTVGVSLLGLPLEEATFFLVTNVLVVQGMMMLTDRGSH